MAAAWGGGSTMACDCWAAACGPGFTVISRYAWLLSSLLSRMVLSGSTVTSRRTTPGVVKVTCKPLLGTRKVWPGLRPGTS